MCGCGCGCGCVCRHLLTFMKPNIFYPKTCCTEVSTYILSACVRACVRVCMCRSLLGHKGFLAPTLSVCAETCLWDKYFCLLHGPTVMLLTYHNMWNKCLLKPNLLVHKSLLAPTFRVCVQKPAATFSYSADTCSPS